MHGEDNNYTCLALRKNHVNLLLQTVISTDEDPSLRIKTFAKIELGGVSTKLNKYKIIFYH